MQKRVLAFLILTPAVAFAQSRNAQERVEVTKIFDVILSKMNVRSGDGFGSDVDCVFAQKWDPSYHRNAKGEPTKQFYPHEQLTIQQAIDAGGQHADMFCNYAERDAQARKTADDLGKRVAVASVGFSYPDFENGLRTATVYYNKMSQMFVPNRRGLPVGSSGVITLKKQNGSWSFKAVTTGTVN
jgi:hypothetical protein